MCEGFSYVNDWRLRACFVLRARGRWLKDFKLFIVSYNKQSYCLSRINQTSTEIHVGLNWQAKYIVLLCVHISPLSRSRMLRIRASCLWASSRSQLAYAHTCYGTENQRNPPSPCTPAPARCTARGWRPVPVPWRSRSWETSPERRTKGKTGEVRLWERTWMLLKVETEEMISLLRSQDLVKHSKEIHWHTTTTTRPKSQTQPRNPAGWPWLRVVGWSSLSSDQTKSHITILRKWKCLLVPTYDAGQGWVMFFSIFLIISR